MTSNPPLRPTLWRTCRVLANRTRLQIFALLVRRRSQTVSAIADRIEVPLSVASQNLRALEARGLLEVRRSGRRVYYRLNLATAGGQVQPIVEALFHTFQRDAAA